MKWIIRVAGIIVLLLIVFAIFFPTHGYPDRARVSEFFVLASATKEKIAGFIQSHPLGTPVVLIDHETPFSIGRYNDMESSAGNPVYIEYFEIKQSGAIIIMTSGLPVYIELTPILEGQQVKTWHCYGRPHKLMPSMCRNEKLIKSV